MPNIFLEKKNKNRNNSVQESKVVSTNKENYNKDYIKHVPVASKEWSNSLYLYNKNIIKFIPVFDKIVIKFIKSYFNQFKTTYSKKAKANKLQLSINTPFKQQLVESALKNLKRKVKIIKKLKKLNKLNLLIEMKKQKKQAFLLSSESKQNKVNKCLFTSKLKLFKARQRLIKAKKRSLNNIVISKAELKHTNSKVIITFYIYNTEERSLLRKLNSNNVNPLLKNTYNNFHNKIKIIKTKSWKLILKKTLFFFIISKKMKWLNNHEKFQLYLLKLYNNFLNDFTKKSFKKEKLVLYYKSLLYFNKRKFENTYLLPLNLLISKLYGKKVEFNLVNLKYLHLNSDIMSQFISKKLKKKQVVVLNVLNSFLYSAKLHTNIGGKGGKYFLLNTYNKTSPDKYTQSSLDNPILFLKEKKDQEIKNSKLIEKTKVKNFNLNTLLISKALQEQKEKNNKNLMDHISQGIFLKKNDKYSNYLKITTIDSIKYKWVNGIRIETAGSLSKRLNQRRSVFKFKYNGNLKNIYSSFKGISSVLLRGHAKPNIDYTKLTSKNRKGSFGLKGWISSI